MKAVITAIRIIDTVEYTAECETLINDARTAYNALTDAKKALVVNYETLTAAEETYAALKAAAESTTDPAAPNEPQEDNLCKLCGKDHSDSVWHEIIGFFHKILFYFAHLIGS